MGKDYHLSFRVMGNDYQFSVKSYGQWLSIFCLELYAMTITFLLRVIGNDYQFSVKSYEQWLSIFC